jgi:quinol monooxygenase YgiN
MMLFDRIRPHAFREVHVTAATASFEAQRQRDALMARAARKSGLENWALHLSIDKQRIIIVEAWRNTAAYWADPDASQRHSVLYTWAGTGGIEPTPVNDPNAGVIIIDIVRVWRPLLRPVTAITLRNGEAFNREPGCISTIVLRGKNAGRLATYARWRSESDFFAAFTKQTGKPVASCGNINAAAARMTFGFIKPDYHAYELVSCDGDV